MRQKRNSMLTDTLWFASGVIVGALLMCWPYLGKLSFWVGFYRSGKWVIKFYSLHGRVPTHAELVEAAQNGEL